MQEIRNKDGERNPDMEAGLRLLLEDFSFRRKSGVYEGLGDAEIFIPASRLFDLLAQAEQTEQLSEMAIGRSISPSWWC